MGYNAVIGVKKAKEIAKYLVSSAEKTKKVALPGLQKFLDSDSLNWEIANACVNELNRLSIHASLYFPTKDVSELKRFFQLFIDESVEEKTFVRIWSRKNSKEEWGLQVINSLGFAKRMLGDDAQAGQVIEQNGLQYAWWPENQNPNDIGKKETGGSVSSVQDQIIGQGLDATGKQDLVINDKITVPDVERTNVQVLGKGGKIRSILRQSTDLKGDPKEPWMLLVGQHYEIEINHLGPGNYVLRDSLTRQGVRKIKDKPYSYKYSSVDAASNQARKVHKETVKAAIKASQYENAIKAGKMTTGDAMVIIYDVNLKVPKTISDLDAKHERGGVVNKSLEELGKLYEKVVGYNIVEDAKDMTADKLADVMKEMDDINESVGGAREFEVLGAYVTKLNNGGDIDNIRKLAGGGTADDKPYAELRDKIESMLKKELPGFWIEVSPRKALGEVSIAIKMAANNVEINRVDGQRPQAVSLWLKPEKWELHPQVFGGNGGQYIYLIPDKDHPREKYLAMAGYKIPFRTPKKDEASVMRAIQGFAEKYKDALKQNRNRLMYQDVVDYDELLADKKAAGGAADGQSEYQKQANDFLQETGTNFKAVYLKHDYHFVGDKDRRNIYQITLSNDRGRYSFKFGQSIANKGQVPDAYDVLSSITKHDPGSFADFCSEFGYSTDEPQSKRIYNSVVKEWEGVSKLFTEQQLEKLAEIS